MQQLIKRLTSLTPEERERAKHEILAWFRRAELRAIKGTGEAKTDGSLHKRRVRTVINRILIYGCNSLISFKLYLIRHC